MKKVLMLTAKEIDVPFILQAQMLGYYVITTGNNPNQVGHRYGDEYIPFDYSDYEGITQMAKKENIDAVMAGCSDNCVLTAAYICDHLGIKGHDNYEVTETIHRKNKFKEFARKNNIKTPIANYYNSKNQAYEDCDRYSYPIIVKPVDLAGGQGVNVITSKLDYKKYIDIAFDRSNSKRIVIEPYIEGTLHSLHVFIIDEKVYCYGTANDYSYMNRYMTNYGIFPADNWREATSDLIPEINRIAKLLHLVDGQMDIQYIMSKDGPWIIEMMRRHPGNHTTSVIGNSIGINWREWISRAELGENVKCMPKANEPQKYFGYYAIMGDHNGIYDGYTIDEQFRKFVIQVDEWETSGFEITNYLEQKVALVQFCFNNIDEKKRYMPYINEMIKVEYRR